MDLLPKKDINYDLVELPLKHHEEYRKHTCKTVVLNPLFIKSIKCFGHPTIHLDDQYGGLDIDLPVEELISRLGLTVKWMEEQS